MPLESASKDCSKALWLLKMGADFNMIPKVGHSSVHFGCKNDQCSVFDYLRKLQFLGYNLIGVEAELNFDVRFSMDPSILLICNQELETLRNSVISWTPRATLYSILLMKRNKMARFSGNENLERIFEECNKDFETKYPCFGSVVNVQYRRGLKRRDLLDLGKISFAKVLGTSFPEDPGELIFKYLDNYELESFGNTKWDSL